MIDLHCHLLPGIDDGSANMATSLKLANEAVDNGVTYALLTPHHMNGMYINHKDDVIRMSAEFQQQLKLHNIPLTVFPGQEVRINGDLLTAVDQDDILFADESGRYLMLEFPDDDVPTYTDDMIYQLQTRGIIPVIVHPERNTKIMRHPDLIYDLLQKGCLSQITASSYIGTFGDKVEQFCRQLIEAGQGYVFSSDAHNLPGRKYEMKEAFAKLRQEFGAEMVDEYNENAKAIINGDPVVQHRLSFIKEKRRRFFGFF
ncbi:tyrosine protein phosphatase [Lactobacillus sp. LC28-10]|uniref:Tyrosine-protein phosphatase n=1 Tax=Secundilactobacillus angelensis TaxID=2722706 RepID=A0ABX1KWM7_9LACO|nr:CpsB/CapC family capsule biosynthesis tyrosine phosphatase [Secundilactobacillus angelensis]MCH5463423.1 tyrosine protein phosphatase [Secundilactobacillus angelensis]NLR18316.1 tyrosine protein phosphatase [Secundilactobacillus angelensis]